MKYNKINIFKDLKFFIIFNPVPSSFLPCRNPYLMNLQNAIKKLNDNTQAIFEYVKKEVNELKKEMDVMKKEIDTLKNVSTNASKYDNELNGMKKRIF